MVISRNERRLRCGDIEEREKAEMQCYRGTREGCDVVLSRNERRLRCGAIEE